ncbi:MULTISPECIES: hypothetical protein [unclassified Sphingobium]|uniref:hypothetical protein n=1 Tax=unclassified Sphingobium TaxID=2611147 RepID=UPI00129052CD|nr:MULTISPECIES: hypothetical protein [unclassified Sphingobium]
MGAFDTKLQTFLERTECDGAFGFLFESGTLDVVPFLCIAGRITATWAEYCDIENIYQFIVAGNGNHQKGVRVSMACDAAGNRNTFQAAASIKPRQSMG